MRNCFEGGCARCLARSEGKIKSGENLDRCRCVHAEANAIMHCALEGGGAVGNDAVLYTTLVPCLECAKLAITVGIRRFVCYEDSYPESSAGFLKDAGATVDFVGKGTVEKIMNGAVQGL